jgi:tRNA (guanine37-N1)-methyltransferase
MEKSALALRVPRAAGEEVRRLLARKGLLDPTREVGKEGDAILFPLRRRPWLPPRSTRVVRVPLEVRERAAAEEALEELPLGAELIGDLAVLKVREESPATPDEERNVAEALLRARPRLKTVLRPETFTEGAYRTRTYRVVAGEPRTSTLYRENGFAFHVDLARAYFSPRLAAERARVAALVQPGETVADLTAGGGYFTVQAARRARRVVACDANPAAVELLRKNLELNKLANVEVREGDFRETVRDERVDRAVLDFPTDPAPFLEAARRVLRPGGVLHLYGVVPEGDPEALARLLGERLRGDEVREVRRLRPYAPGKSLAVAEVVARASTAF